MEGHDYRGRRDAGNDIAHLAETLDVLSRHFTLILADDGKVASQPRSCERHGEVDEMNCLHSSLQDPTDPLGRFISNDLAVLRGMVWK